MDAGKGEDLLAQPKEGADDLSLIEEEAATPVEKTVPVPPNTPAQEDEEPTDLTPEETEEPEDVSEAPTENIAPAAIPMAESFTAKVENKNSPKSEAAAPATIIETSPSKAESDILPKADIPKPLQTALPETHNPTPVSASWIDSMPYSVQVNSYDKEADAEKRMERLKQGGYDSFSYPVYLSKKKGTYYRVFVGRYQDAKSAQKAREELKKTGDFEMDIFVVSRSRAIGG
jgi:cell division septation protein DedD